MEETTKVKFSIVGYMHLLNQKNQVIQELNSLFDIQNKEAISKCKELGLLEDNGSIKGFKISENEEEAKSMKGLYETFISTFLQQGGKSDVELDLKDFESKLAITLSDISKCIIP